MPGTPKKVIENYTKIKKDRRDVQEKIWDLDGKKIEVISEKEWYTKQGYQKKVVHYKDIGKGKHFTYDSRTGKLRASYDVFWVDSDGKKLDNQKDIDKIIASGYEKYKTEFEQEEEELEGYI